MVAKGYRADLKCCTYFPYLPNFSIGAILETGTQEQKRVLASTLQKGHATPLGLFAPPEYQALQTELGPLAFGRDPRLICPFLLTDCAIWEYRPGVCASHFCQSEATSLWKDIETKINLFEWTLAHESLWRLGFTTDETRLMENRREAGCPESTWYEYKNAQEELYRKAYVQASMVSPREIAHLMSGAR